MSELERDITKREDESAAESFLGPEEEKKQKKLQKKQLRKERRLQKKQLRREVRKRKRDEFRAKTIVGKVFYILKRAVHILFLAAVLLTVYKVNFNETVVFMIERVQEYYQSRIDMDAVTQEEIDEIMPVDEDGAAAIMALPEHGEDETWAIYMYIVGSDLEAKTYGQLSEATRYYTNIEAQKIMESERKNGQEKMVGFLEELLSNDMDLPEFFYEKAIPHNSVIPDEMYEIMKSHRSDYHAASTDIHEILAVDLPENVKMVIQAGGAGNWAYNKINPNRTQRFLYDSQGMRLVSDEHISNMGDAETLSNFLSYCKEEHPADHTMILFWNHGSGAFGYGVDVVYGEDRLTLEELREAFSVVYQPNEENPPIDLIGFDACLMASMEVANTFHGFASYLVGSEEVEPGEGWYYTDWLGKLAENPQMNAAQLGKTISDSYMEYYSRASIAQKAPASELFSLIDLKYIDDLYAAYDAFAGAALKKTAEYPGMVALIGQAANRSIKYAGAAHTSCNTMDLGMFMDEVMEYYPQEAKAVRDLLDRVVVYNLPGQAVRESQGITVYYPSTICDLDGLLQCLTYINDVCESDNISALYYYKIAGCLREDMAEYIRSQGYGEISKMNRDALKAMETSELTILEDGNYSTAISDDAIMNTQTIGYNLLQAKDGKLKSLGCSSFIIAKDSNTLETAYDCTWLCMDGQPLAVDMVSHTEKVISFASDIQLTSSAGITEAYLLVSYDFESKEWSILGVQEKNETDERKALATKNTIDLNFGDRIVPMYETYDEENEQWSIQYGEEIRYDENTKLAEEILNNGEYVSYISIVDFRGDIYELPEVSFEIKNGAMANAKKDNRDFID